MGLNIAMATIRGERVWLHCLGAGNAAGKRSIYALTTYAMNSQGAVANYCFKVGQAGLTQLTVQ